MVSDAVVDIVRGVTVKPSFFIAKGGITSHDIAVKSFQIHTARVLGQVDPGVPGTYPSTLPTPLPLCLDPPPPPLFTLPTPLPLCRPPSPLPPLPISLALRYPPPPPPHTTTTTPIPSYPLSNHTY